MSDLAFGLQITVYGMGLVFGLLMLLWGLLVLAGRLEPGASGPHAVTPGDGPSVEVAPGEADAPLVQVRGHGGAADAPQMRVRGQGVEALPPEALAAITAAVLAHAANRRRQAAPEMRSYWPGSLLFASRWVAAGRMRQTTRVSPRGRR